jgi:hypothetical protein
VDQASGGTGLNSESACLGTAAGFHIQQFFPHGWIWIGRCGSGGSAAPYTVFAAMVVVRIML